MVLLVPLTLLLLLVAELCLSNLKLTNGTPQVLIFPKMVRSSLPWTNSMATITVTTNIESIFQLAGTATGTTTAFFTATPTGGTAPYTYAWSAVNNPSQGAGTISPQSP